jgi:hypothetical protein
MNIPMTKINSVLIRTFLLVQQTHDTLHPTGFKSGCRSSQTLKHAPKPVTALLDAYWLCRRAAER